MANRIALFPGSFDPFTNGHWDILQTAVSLFDKVHIAIGSNSAKKSLLTAEERQEIIETTVSGYENVSVGIFDGLLVTYAQSVSADVIVRGLRQSVDFAYEQRMAIANRLLDPELATVFLTPHSENLMVSSTIVRDIYTHGGDFGMFVPDAIRKMLESKRASETT